MKNIKLWIALFIVTIAALSIEAKWYGRPRLGLSFNIGRPYGYYRYGYNYRPWRTVVLEGNGTKALQRALDKYEDLVDELKYENDALRAENKNLRSKLDRK